MILRKVIIDGKVVYEPISYEEALAYPNIEELVFTSDDEKEEFEKKIGELKELSERFVELNENIDDIMVEIAGLAEDIKYNYTIKLEKIKSELNDLKNSTSNDLEAKLDEIEEKLEAIEEEIDEADEDSEVKFSFGSKNINFDKDFGETFGKAFGNMFSGKKNDKVSNLIAALPFMDKADLHELVEKILAEAEEYKDLSLTAIYPFLDTEDCDSLFMKFVIESKEVKHSIVTLVPFVSRKCLSKFVDEYVNGNFQDVEMNLLYPFLDSKDVKRVFNYMLNKKNNPKTE